MRKILFIATIFLLSGCGQNFLTHQARPDELTFPPLEFHFPSVDQKQLDNGLKVYLKEDHELPLVELTVLVRGGRIYDPLSKTGLSQFFARTLSTGGTLNSTPQQLERELESMAAELTVSSSLYGYEIDMSLNQQDLPRGIEILADLLRRPRFDTARMEIVKAQMLEALMRQNDDPGSIARRVFNKAVYPDHPLGASPTRRTLRGFGREDLVKIHRQYFQPQNIWLAVSGDIKTNNLMSLLQQQLGDWSSEDDFISELPLPPAPPSSRILLVDKDIPQTTILLGHPGVSKDNPDVFAIRVMNFILGGGGFNSRMMREIRSDRGLAYSVYSYFQIGRELPGLFVAGSETKCGSTDEVLRLLRREIQRICDEPVSAVELDMAKKSLINSFIFAFEDTHSIVSRQLRLDYYNYPTGYLETYRQKLEAVTIADVQRVARTYLHSTQLQIVLVGDSEQYRDKVTTLGIPVETVNLKAIQ